MRYHFKIVDSFLDDVRADLERPHEFAWERVGFIRVGLAMGQDETLMLAAEYSGVADEDYEQCWSVGAKINANAIRKALAWADGWRGGIIHIHAHQGYGKPKLSPDDREGNERLIPTFFNVAPSKVHGAVILSDDQFAGLIWPSKTALPIEITRFSVVGSPMRIIRHE